MTHKLQVTDFPLHDLPRPMGLTRAYCLDRRLVLNATGGFFPFARRSYDIWDEDGSLRLTCRNQDFILEDIKVVKDSQGAVLYLLDTPRGQAYSHIRNAEKPIGSCGDDFGPKRDFIVDFDVLGTKRRQQWQIILINDRDDGVVVTEKFKTVARFTQRGWLRGWVRNNRRVEVAKYVDYSLIVTALAVMDLAGSSGDLLNPTREQVLTPTWDLWMQLDAEEEEDKRRRAERAECESPCENGVQRAAAGVANGFH
ncbi:hypothetical protein I317_05121 [Kwoniella heveanensis CBS 569]|uniref:Uncharacterized protein n=1 Tax=Kwoniella heveanensis BCC8398 TaxID=1296120 RepID=A0A1B9GXQ7_9TREE|nr:hypothetical protein I316_02305 [Kwoniella heveanensis BCC8398]OCF41110.1 hypothetical protein I317_05121 [Kwoniella heveanensis CBS 569]